MNASKPADAAEHVEALPFVDAYTIEVNASPQQAWDRLAQALPDFGGGWGRIGTGRLGRAGARFMHAPYADQPARTAHLPQTITGFRVERATRPSLIALVGEHRFASYALTLRIDPLPSASSCRLTAETRAAFPGAAGRAYRALVIGTGAHRVVVARLLHRAG